MILLTKLDNTKILLNLEVVKYIESVPDTLIIFINGDSLIVRESLEEVEARVVELKRKILENADQSSK